MNRGKRALISLIGIGLLALLPWAPVHAGRPVMEDTFVRASAPGTAFDGQRLSTVGSTSNCNLTDITYLKWDLSDVAGGSTAGAAALSLRVRTKSGTSAATRVSLYQAGDSWSEDTLTWNTRPAAGALIETVPLPVATAPFTLTFASPALADYVNAQLAGDHMASFAVQVSAGCSAGATVVIYEDAEHDALAGPQLALFGPTAIGLRAVRVSAAPAGDGTLPLMVMLGLGTLAVWY